MWSSEYLFEQQMALPHLHHSVHQLTETADYSCPYFFKQVFLAWWSPPLHLTPTHVYIWPIRLSVLSVISLAVSSDSVGYL